MGCGHESHGGCRENLHADGLGIALCLVDMLPTIPLQLAFNMATPGLTGFAPEVYAARPKSRTDLLDFSHVPPLKSKWNAMSVLHVKR